MTVLFWLAVGLTLYTIIGYPLVLLTLVRFVARRPNNTQPPPQSFTFVIAAHNEEACIAEKLRNTLSQGGASGFALQVLVVSDGSTDETLSRAGSVGDARITVVAAEGRQGKALALNQILPKSVGEIVVFTDANSFLAPGALEAIAQHFRDPQIGGVCGRITVDKSRAGAIGRGEKLYWAYDQMLKLAESRLGGTVSAQGSLYAIRRELTAPLRIDCADDFYNSVRVVAAGKRLAFEPDARATEVVTDHAAKEMGRRIRSTERGWRAMMAFWWLMNPFRHGFYAFQLFSHKFLRRLVPFFLVAAFVANLFLLEQDWFYRVVGACQIAAYLAVILAAAVPALRRVPVIRELFFFAMSNLAMALGLVRFLRGKKSTLWKPVRD